MPSDPPDRAESSRAYAVAMAVVLGLALVGFLIGVRPVPSPEPSSWRQSAAVTDEAQLPPTAYSQLRQRLAGPNGRPTSSLDVLRTGLPSATDPVLRDPSARAEAAARRAERRAFEGAPPVVPHDVDEQTAGACLGCHGEGVIVAGSVAPVMSHRLMVNCTQCHVSVFDRMGDPAVTASNDFSGRGMPGSGERAWTGAPPRIPHEIWMRSDCDSCHGLTGLPGIRTTHPERRSCEQCHAPTESPQPWAQAQ